VIVTGDTAHVVVNRGLYRDRFFRNIDTREDTRRLGDTREPFLNDFGSEVLEVQVDVIMFRAYTATFADLHGHCATHDVA
jgi:hypothetical protein